MEEPGLRPITFRRDSDAAEEPEPAGSPVVDYRPSLHALAVRIQAVYRGFVVRKSIQADPAYKQQRRRVLIVNELIDSEASYVRFLRAVCQAYIHPMRGVMGTKDQILNQFELQTLFGNLESILGLNNTLLGHLQSAREMWAFFQAIGAIFLELSPFLKLYAVYVNNYTNALNTLTRLLQRNRVFARFVKEAASQPGCEGLDLASLLIMPIQRIPRYRLLLEDLVKHTPTNHADYETLVDAVSNVRSIAEYVNERKRQWESIERVYEIQRHVTGHAVSLVAPSRRFVAEGPVFSSAEAALASTAGGDWWVLFSDALMITRRKSAKPVDLYDYKDMIGLERLTLRDTHSEGGVTTFGFRLEARLQSRRRRSRRFYNAFFKTADEKQSWIRAITAAIREHLQRQRNFELEDKVAWEGFDVASPPAGRAHHTATLIGERLYIFGGVVATEVEVELELPDGSAPDEHTKATSDTATELIEDPSNELWSLDLAAEGASWQRIGETSSRHAPRARYWHGAVAVNGCVYIFGGTDGETCFDDVWYFSADTGEWTQVAVAAGTTRPSARAGHSATAFGDKIYIAGGRDEHGVCLSDTLWIFDTAEGTWTQPILSGGELLSPRAWHAACRVGESLYLHGGFNGARTLAELLIVNTGTLVVTAVEAPKEDSPASRYMHSLALAGTKVYAFGGRTPLRTFDDLWEIDTKANTWSKPATAGLQPSRRFGHSCTLSARRLLFFGGRTPEEGHLFSETHCLHLISKLRTELFQQLRTRAKASRKAFDETFKVMAGLGKGSEEISGRALRRVREMTWFLHLDEKAQERLARAVHFEIKNEVSSFQRSGATAPYEISLYTDSRLLKPVLPRLRLQVIQEERARASVFLNMSAGAPVAMKRQTLQPSALAGGSKNEPADGDASAGRSVRASMPAPMAVAQQRPRATTDTSRQPLFRPPPSVMRPLPEESAEEDAALRRELIKERRDAAAARMELTRAESRSESLASQLEKERASRGVEADKLRGEIALLRERAAESEEKIAACTRELRSESELVIALKDRIESDSRQRSDLEHMIRELKRKIEVFEAEAAEAAETRQAMERELDTFRHAEAKAREKDAREAQLGALVEIENARREKAALEARIAAAAGGPAAELGADKIIWQPDVLVPDTVPETTAFLRISYNNAFYDTVVPLEIELGCLRAHLSERLGRPYAPLPSNRVSLRFVDSRTARLVTISNNRQLRSILEKFWVGGDAAKKNDGDENSTGVTVLLRPTQPLRLYVARRARFGFLSCLPV